MLNFCICKKHRPRDQLRRMFKMDTNNEYRAPVAQTDHVSIFPHNQPGLAADGTKVAYYAPDEELTASQVLDVADTKTLRGMFNDIATHAATRDHDGRGQLVIFHAVNPDDDINRMNFKLTKLHFHVIADELSAECAHIETQKTYVPAPNPHIADDLRKLVADKGIDCQTAISLTGSDIAEAASHDIITHPGYANLADFTTNAPDDEIEKLRQNMKDVIAPYTEKGRGGVRIVIDERFNNTGFFTMHFLGGEQMGQQPDKSHRWFQKPKSPAI